MKRVVLSLLLFFVAANAAAQAFTVDDYIAGLSRVRAALLKKDLAAARSEAGALRGKRITSPAGDFHADDALLADAMAATKHDRVLPRRIALAIHELRDATQTTAVPVDHDALKKAAEAQRLRELPAGGKLPTKIQREVPWLVRLAEAIGAALEWIGNLLGRIFDWFLDFFPRRTDSGQGGGIGGTMIAVVAVIVLLVIILAVGVVRRGRRAARPEVAVSAPIGSTRDEDPLSRGANEWERYAALLANDERWREAIRAWYHAVLVTLYAAGVLHFRKGRTNWEYISALPPTLAWRGRFIELTRHFEREWYGSLRSTAEAYDDCSARAQELLETIRRGARGAA